MVAEAVPATEETQVQGTVPETPEVTPESVTPEVQEEEVADFSSFWSDDGETTESPTGLTPAPDNADPYAGLTPEQILERGAERERARQQETANTEQARARVEGTRTALNNSKQTIKETLREQGIDAETLLRLDPAIDKVLDGFHGSHIALRKADYDEGVIRGQQSILEGLKMGVDRLLGPDAAPKFFEEHQGKPWPDAYDALVDAALKKKGYVSPTELKKDWTKKSDVETRLKRIDTAMKERGLSIAQFTGEANPRVPPMRGGSNLTPGSQEWAENASIEELKRFRAQQGA